MIVGWSENGYWALSWNTPAARESLCQGIDECEGCCRVAGENDPRLPLTERTDPRQYLFEAQCVHGVSVTGQNGPKQGRWTLSTPPVIRDDRSRWRPPGAVAEVEVVQEIRWFDEIGLKDTGSVGGKGANLGELTAGGLPVPPGFVITGEAYLDAIDRAGIRERLVAILAEARRASQDDLDRLAGEARDLVHGVPIPEDLAAGIVAAYQRLGADIRVAVRSSGIGEDAEGTSFAGMNETFTNVAGRAELLTRVVDCWASLWGARSIFYRGDKELTAEPAIAVVVQEMVPSERSGVMFTVDPSTGETDHIVIEAAFGQGEVVVSGQVEPDTYVVSKEGPRLLHARVGTQFFKIVRGPDGEDQRVELDAAEGGRRVLSDEDVVELARIGLAAEAHYGSFQDMEWAMAGGHTYLVQSRPVTAVGGAAAPAAAAELGTLLVQGLAASAGRASGVVRVLQSPDQGDRLQAGEVLVAPMTSPDWVPTMRRAAAIVTDGGGMTCHAAIVSRELGVPAVVGARNATTVLRDGELVTVDGAQGTVTEGAVAAGGQRPRLWPRRRRRRAPAGPEPSRRGSTSTWPSRSTPRRWPPCRSTAWGCSGPKFMVTDA